MEKQKIGFFRRVKKAIFNFEEYENFMEEPLKRAFGYFFKLMLIFALVTTIALIYVVNTNINKFKTSIKTDFPSFTIENNTLNIEGDSTTAEYNFNDFNIHLIMDEEATAYTGNYSDNSIVMLKNLMFIKYNGIVREIGYNNLGNLSNQIILNFFETNQWKMIYCNICLIMFVLNFILYSILILLDIFTLSIIGLIINTFIRTRFNYKDIVKISIYSMTLSIILYILYISANAVFGTTIKFFQIAYNTISYIYIITVMLMIKSDKIKNTQELQSILEEQKKVKEELKKEKQEEEKKEKENEEEKKKQKGEDKDKEKSPQEPQIDNG